MKFATLFSGGKDSTYCIYYYLQQGWEPVYLVTILPENPHSYMYHTPNVALTNLQARAMGLPIIQTASKGVKEEELEDLRSAISTVKDQIDAVVAGAVWSEYQKTRIERICYEVGLKSYCPLWHKDQVRLLHELVASGFKMVITAVAAQGLDESWLGREIDGKTIRDLKGLYKKHGINPAGEGGEFETLVVDGPIFRRPIQIKESVKHWEKDSGWLEIIKAI
ncbi:MAG: diphthine--ammonia ligase [archaeon]